MPLTPADVANKLFGKEFRGYAMDEVDAFLDEVEAELARLLSETELARRAGTAAPGPGAALPAPVAATDPASAGDAAAADEAAFSTGPTAAPDDDPAPIDVPAPAAQPAAADPASAAEPAGSVSDLGSHEAALRTLLMAQRTADLAVAEARAEADAMLADAHRRSSEIEQEVQERTAAALGSLETKRQDLERRIEDLRAFEREYRVRLKAYLESQMRDLDSRGGGGADDAGTGVPAAARTAAVGVMPTGVTSSPPRSGGSRPAGSTGPPAEPSNAPPGGAEQSSFTADGPEPAAER